MGSGETRVSVVWHGGLVRRRWSGWGRVMRGVLTVKISARVFSGLLDACVAKPGGLLWILGFAAMVSRGWWSSRSVSDACRTDGSLSFHASGSLTRGLTEIGRACKRWFVAHTGWAFVFVCLVGLDLGHLLGF